MKGPGYRLDLEVRRTWRCSNCASEVMLPGVVTQVQCEHCDDGSMMTLVDEYVPRRFVMPIEIPEVIPPGPPNSSAAAVPKTREPISIPEPVRKESPPSRPDEMLDEESTGELNSESSDEPAAAAAPPRAEESAAVADEAQVAAESDEPAAEPAPGESDRP